MILLDPDLEPDSSPHRSGASRGRSGSQQKSKAAPRIAAIDSVGQRLPAARILARFLSRAQSAVRLPGQVTVLLTTDETIRDLNRRFRGKNKATDVLSFPATPLQKAKPAEQIAGDIAISVETARHQAAENGHSLISELEILILHGLLHLAGYDHETDAGEMHRRESSLRAKLGLVRGLIERATGKQPAHPKVRPTAGVKP